MAQFCPDISMRLCIGGKHFGFVPHPLFPRNSERVFIVKGNESFTYQVIEKNIVRTFAISTEADEYLRSVTEPTSEEQLTLITCWPSWSNTHRLVIVAIPAMSKP